VAITGIFKIANSRGLPSNWKLDGSEFQTGTTINARLLHFKPPQWLSILSVKGGWFVPH